MIAVQVKDVSAPWLLPMTYNEFDEYFTAARKGRFLMRVYPTHLKAPVLLNPEAVVFVTDSLR